MINDKIQAKFSLLKESYLQNLPHKLRDIETRWNAIYLSFDKQNFIDFHREIHSLSGTAGTYGYISLGQACRDLEIYVLQLLDYNELNDLQKSEISHLIEQIKGTQLLDKKSPANSSIEFSNRTISKKIMLYLINKKFKFNSVLQQRLSDLGYRLVCLNKISEFQTFINQQLPSLVIVDEHHLDNVEIKEFAITVQYQIPLLCLASRDDMNIRLKAIRAGISFFLSKPVDIFYLTNRLVQLCDLSTNEDYRVLILDDSVTLATYYSLILEESDMSVRAIFSPNHLMDELREFKPNLVLLDLYLPGCTGFEIAKIIRQEDCYMGLPIIFISTENDRIKQLDILNSCGADDFLTKPVLPQNLVSAVKSRARRAALVNSYIALDSLTQLLNHTYILKQLEFEIIRAERFNQSITLAMIDLDYFKQINDKYGHPVGDLVLKKLSQFLLMNVRKADFVGRYGGEEFSILFPNTEQSIAQGICMELCKAMSTQPFKANDDVFYLTLSIGIAHYPTFLTLDSLVDAADKALYKAKSNGRNRVELG